MVTGNLLKLSNGNSSHFEFCFDRLEAMHNKQQAEHFSLNKFLLELSNFFTFCNNNVKRESDKLISIFKYEVSSVILSILGHVRGNPQD